MHSFNKPHFYSFRADANALGGFLKEPLQKSIPTLAPVCLPAAGGFATARSEAFNLDEVVSVSSAYTLVSSRESREEGAISTLVTAVVEDLNILEVVTARRIVAQVSVTSPLNGGAQRVSLGGSRFEELRLLGRDAAPKLNARLLSLKPEARDAGSPFTWPSFRKSVGDQAETLIDRFTRHADKDASEWAKSRHGWKTGDGRVICSLVDDIEESPACSTYGHIVEIPGFGRIFLGELFVTRDSVQLVSIRAELGCPITGVVTGPTVTGPTPSDSGGHGTGSD
jgi:hypothetical protein